MSIPRLRFKGFSNIWKRRKVNQLTCNTFSGGTPSKSNEDYYHGSIPFIRSAEISKKETELHINEKALNNSSAKMINKGTILYALYGANSGTVSIAKISGAINQAIMDIQVNNNNSVYFVETLLSWLRPHILKKYLQGGQGNLSGKIVKSIQLKIPSLPEQRLIGKFFAKLDKLISLQQAKYSLLNKQKQGYLQKLFPRKNQPTPRIRFNGFNDNWTIKSISMMAHVRGGGAFKSKNFVKSGIPVLRISNIQRNNVGGTFKFYAPNKSFDKYLLTNGAILIAMSGATVGKIAMISSSKRFYQNQRVGYFDTNDNTNNYFLYSLLQSDKFFDNLDKIKVSGAQPNISSKDLDNFKFKVPDIKEQELIGQFFKQLDDNITLQSEKLHHLRKLKKAYLQKMFC